MYITCTEYNYAIAYNAMYIRITTTHRVIDVGIGGDGEIGGCVRVGGRYFPSLITKCTHDNPICWVATGQGEAYIGNWDYIAFPCPDNIICKTFEFIAIFFFFFYK